MKTKMTSFRIYTEDKNREAIRRILNASFEAYTVNFAIGVWRTVEESSLVIDLLLPYGETTRAEVQQVAKAIRETNQQECVLVVEIDASVEFV